MQVVVAMPVYEDWESAAKLCEKIDTIFSKEAQLRLSVILIDDGSTNAYSSQIPLRLETIEKVSVLLLRRNLGHQRAIAVALPYIQQHCRGDALVVMDADGEDRPEDILRMLEVMGRAEPPIAVFAERGRRLENAIFRFFYKLYGILHVLLAGRDIRFGNFSVIPWVYLDSLVAYPELWNHYAATFLKSRLPYTRVCCDRSVRIAGRSHMTFTNLVVHGMSALFANQELVGTRLLMAVIAMTTGLLLISGLVVGIKMFTHLAIPGWATFALGLLLLMAVSYTHLTLPTICSV